METGKAGINLNQIWNTQEVPPELQVIIQDLAPQIARAIRETPAGAKDVGEYCKMQACWERISKQEFAVSAVPEHLTLDVEDNRTDERSARATARLDDDIDFDVFLLSLVDKVDLVRRTAERRGLLSPKSSGALDKLERGVIALGRPEKNAIRLLVRRLEEEGAPVEAIG